MTPAPEAELASLMAKYPLSGGWKEPQVFTEAVRIHGLSIRVAGVATQVNDEWVTGSAGSMFESPLKRAYLELIERLSVVSAIADPGLVFRTWSSRGASRVTLPRQVLFPTAQVDATFCWSRSNGVAVGETWKDAARRARYELIERDRVLRSWYGEGAPQRTALESIPPELHSSYEFESYELGRVADTTTVGVFGFPRRDEPLVYGFAARSMVVDATASAAAECLQRLAFLWGEALPDRAPMPVATPDFHQEFYLYRGNHERIRRWLRGEHRSLRGILPAPSELLEPTYVDLTPDCLRLHLRVAKAIPAGHVPLTFGPSHPFLRCQAPEEVAVHPIA